MHFSSPFHPTDRPTDRKTDRRPDATARRRDRRTRARERGNARDATRREGSTAIATRGVDGRVIVMSPPGTRARANVTAVVGGVVGDRGRRRGKGERARRCARSVVGVRALRPNAEWPPEDVWEDFGRRARGRVRGAAATFDGKTGRAMRSSGTVPSRMRSKSTAWT